MIRFELTKYEEKPVVSYEKGDVIVLREVDDGSFHYVVENEIVVSFTDDEYRNLLKAGIASFGSSMLQGELLFHMFADAVDIMFFEMGKDIKTDTISVTPAKFKEYFTDLMQDFACE